MTLVLDFCSLSWAVSTKRFSSCSEASPPVARCPNSLDPWLNASHLPGDCLDGKNNNFFGALQQKLLQCSNYRN
jgi:hypothetical protein